MQKKLNYMLYIIFYPILIVKSCSLYNLKKKIILFSDICGEKMSFNDVIELNVGGTR